LHRHSRRPPLLLCSFAKAFMNLGEMLFQVGQK
jgi:hypothetical protein